MTSTELRSPGSEGELWFRNLPADWEMRRAKFIFKKMERPIREQDEVVTAFRDGRVTLRSNRRTEGYTFSTKEIGYQGIRRGDLVVHEMDAFAGAIGVSDSDGKSTPVYTVLRPQDTEETHSQYYAYLLRYLATSGFIQSLSQGIRQRSTDFRYNVLKDLRLPVPEHSDQKSIADFLDRETARIDELVAQKERLLKLLDEKRTALITRAVTRGLDPDVPMKDSGLDWLGTIPKHWELRLGKYLFEELNQKVKDEHEVVTCFRDGEVTLRSNRRTEGFTNAILEAGYQAVYPGQLVIQSMDAFAGAIGVSDSEGKCSPEYIVCGPQRDGLDPQYYAHALRTMAKANFIQAICPSVRQRAPRFRYSSFATTTMPLPPIGEQRAITKFIKESTRELNALRDHISVGIDHAKEYRTALISAAVTGQIDVRDKT